MARRRIVRLLWWLVFVLCMVGAFGPLLVGPVIPQ